MSFSLLFAPIYWVVFIVAAFAYFTPLPSKILSVVGGAINVYLSWQDFYNPTQWDIFNFLGLGSLNPVVSINYGAVITAFIYGMGVAFVVSLIVRVFRKVKK